MERLLSDERPEITFIIQMIEKVLNESGSLETALQQLADLDEAGIEAAEKMNDRTAGNDNSAYARYSGTPDSGTKQK